MIVLLGSISDIYLKLKVKSSMGSYSTYYGIRDLVGLAQRPKPLSRENIPPPKSQEATFSWRDVRAVFIISLYDLFEKLQEQPFQW